MSFYLICSADVLCEEFKDSVMYQYFPARYQTQKCHFSREQLVKKIIKLKEWFVLAFEVG